MDIIDQKMNDFQSKPYEERLKISMNIITNLKDRGNAQAQEIFDIVSGMDKVPDNLVNAIYKDFCDSVERVKQERIQWELAQFDKSKDYMQKLREREAQERAWEDADLLLEGL